MKRVILCYKEHDKSFIWNYFTYDISKAILDLDQDFCQFFVLSNFVNSEHRDTYDTSEKSCRKGLHFFFLRLRSLSNLWGRYDPKTEKT